MKNANRTHQRRFATLPLIAAAALALALTPSRGHAQGMPAAARESIHTLFSQHTNVTRQVTMTKDGYVSVTESSDPRLAKVLREHVSQMRERLQSGRMVRGWDPAFRELVEHYDDITHRVEATDKGLKISVKGKTPAAIAVAKNHAQIVSGFATKGWAAHDTRHPLAVKTIAQPAAAKASTIPDKACCLADKKGPAAAADPKKAACCQTECKHCEK